MAIESPRASEGAGLAGKRRSRVEECRRLLEERKLDALLFASPASVFYLTGFLVSAYTRLVAAFLMRGERPRLIVPAIESPIAERLAWDGDVIQYLGDGREAHEAIAAGLGKIRARTIGVELNAIPLALAEDLRHRLGGSALTDASPYVEPLWWKKDSAEVTYISHAGEISAAAVRRAQEAIDAGEPELAAKAEGDHTALSLAAQRYPDERVQLFSNVVTGSRTIAGGGHELPTGRRPVSGELAFYVWAVNVEGYWALISRSTTIGAPSPAVLDIIRRVEAAKQAALQSVRARATTAAVFQAAAAGFGSRVPQMTFSVGRGIGAGMGETPVIEADGRHQLEPGMVLRLGPEVFGAFGAIGMIDTIAVTDDGCSVLTETVMSEKIGTHRGVQE